MLMGFSPISNDRLLFTQEEGVFAVGSLRKELLLFSVPKLCVSLDGFVPRFHVLVHERLRKRATSTSFLLALKRLLSGYPLTDVTSCLTAEVFSQRLLSRLAINQHLTKVKLSVFVAEPRGFTLQACRFRNRR